MERGEIEQYFRCEEHNWNAANEERKIIEHFDFKTSCSIEKGEL
jgi:hypothetical protein